MSLEIATTPATTATAENGTTPVATPAKIEAAKLAALRAEVAPLLAEREQLGAALQEKERTTLRVIRAFLQGAGINPDLHDFNLETGELTPSKQPTGA